MTISASMELSQKTKLVNWQFGITIEPTLGYSDVGPTDDNLMLVTLWWWQNFYNSDFFIGDFINKLSPTHFVASM